MLHAKFQDHRNCFLKKKILKEFYHMWVLGPSWSCDQDHFHIFCPFFPRNLQMKFGFYWPSDFRKIFENNGHVHVYSQGQGKTTLRVQFVLFMSFFFSIQTHRRPNLTSQLNRSRSTKAYHLYKRYRPQAPKCCMPIFKIIGLLVLEKKIVKGFYHIRALRAS